MAEVGQISTFKILLSNVGHLKRRLPKGMVIKIASKTPFELVPIGAEAGREIYNCLNISTQAVVCEVLPGYAPETMKSTMEDQEKDDRGIKYRLNGRKKCT